MPRPKLIHTHEFPYHITARTNNRDKFPVSLDRVWKIMCEELTYVHYTHGLLIENFVLMPNHIHLVAKTSHCDLGVCMRDFLVRVTNRVNSESGKINRLWGARYYKSLITNTLYLEHVYKYVYQNPIKSSLCKTVENWQYSTLHMLLGLQAISLPICRDNILMENLDQTLVWLNQLPKEEHHNEIQRAVRKRIFSLPRDKKNRRKSALEACRY